MGKLIKFLLTDINAFVRISMFQHYFGIFVCARKFALKSLKNDAQRMKKIFTKNLKRRTNESRKRFFVFDVYPFC
jgi:hypothetical protein